MKISRKMIAGMPMLALALAGCTATYGNGTETAGPPPASPDVISIERTTPPPRDPSELQVLFWNDAQRSARFRDMENWFAGQEVPAASNPRALPKGTPLSAELQAELRTLMQTTKTAGVMVLQDGKVRFEDYGLGLTATDRWTSFSVAKSFTSTLLGAAIQDGYIDSIDDAVTKYIPELAGSAYDGVTVRHVATMTSGVAWNEDYTDPNSDVALMNRFVVEYGPTAVVEQMKRLGREAEPGTKFVYKTGETNLLGMIVENASGLTLAEYFKVRLADPVGLEGDMFWMTDPRGGNIGGCCLSLRLADYARMGQFAIEGGKDMVPEGWFAEATDSAVDFGASGFGYGYQWWTYPQGTYGAQGIFGQGITLFPDKGVVVAYIGNWAKASGGPERGQFLDLSRKIAAETE